MTKGALPLYRRRRRKPDDLPPMPETLEPVAAAARARHMKRHSNPGVSVKLDRYRDAYEVTAPHRNREAWEAMICDAMGTRSAGHAKTFLVQLAQLCDKAWFPNEDGEGGEWHPDEDQLNMILNFVAGVKPRNEMQAALAAQMCAVHLMTMKLSASAMNGHWVAPETAALASKLARTYAMQVEAFARMKGRKAIRQKIVVSYERHDHKHIHYEGGEAKTGAHPQATEGGQDGPDQGSGRPTVEGTCQPAGCPALPSPDEGRRVVPIRRGEGDEGLPDARRQRIGRPQGQG